MTVPLATDSTAQEEWIRTADGLWRVIIDKDGLLTIFDGSGVPCNYSTSWIGTGMLLALRMASERKLLRGDSGILDLLVEQRK